MNKLKLRGWFLLAVLVVVTAVLHAGEIHKASETGDADKVRALLTANPQLINSHNAEDDTPLHVAARKGQLAVVKVLLEFNPKLNATNASRLTPLKLAKGFGHREVAQLLEQRGAPEYVIPTPAPQRLEPAPPPEDPEVTRQRMEKAEGIETLTQDTEWVSTNYNYAMQLPAGWKRMSGPGDTANLTVADALRPSRFFGVTVFEAISMQGRLDDKNMAEVERGFFAKGRATKLSTIKMRVAGQPGYELRGALQNGKGTVLVRLVVTSSFVYCVSGTKMEGDVLGDPELVKSLASFRFLKTPQPVGFLSSLGMNSEKAGYWVGYALGASLVVVLLVAGIVVMVRRRSA